MVLERTILKTWDKVNIWPKIIDLTAKAARLSADEKARLSKSLTAEISTATAYFSGCYDPDRVAIAHLTTLVSAYRCPEVFGHRNQESLADRLLAGNYYPGGNPETIKACMLLLELISLNDHRKDFTADLVYGKSNPLATNLNYDEEKARIEKELNLLDSKIKQVYNVYYQKIIKLSGWF